QSLQPRQETCNDRRPHRRAIVSLRESMAFEAECRYESEVNATAAVAPGVRHAAHERRGKVAVVLRVDPQRWNTRRRAEHASSFDQAFRCAIVVGMIERAAAATARKVDNRGDTARIAARECERAPSTGRVSDNKRAGFADVGARLHGGERSLDAGRTTA